GAEPVGPEAGDQGELREGLDVLNQRGRAGYAALEGQRRREGRLRDAAVQELNEGRFLSRDEAVGDGDRPQAHALVEVVPALVNRRADGITVGALTCLSCRAERMDSCVCS